METQLLDALRRGEKCLEARRPEEAREAFDEALALDNACYEALCGLGRALVGLERFDEAVDALEAAVDLRPQSREALYDLGRACQLAGRGDEAIRSLTACAEWGGASVELYDVLQSVLVDEGDLDGAVACASRAIELEPGNPRLYVDKAQLLLACGRHEDALACLRGGQRMVSDGEELRSIEVKVRAEVAARDRA